MAQTNPTNSTSQFYRYDGVNRVAVTTSAGHTTDAFLFEAVDDPLRLARSGTSYFYELDLAGNVRRIRSATGADLGGYRYTAFGRAFPADTQTPAPTTDQPLRWKGRWFEGNVSSYPVLT